MEEALDLSFDRLLMMMTHEKKALGIIHSHSQQCKQLWIKIKVFVFEIDLTQLISGNIGLFEMIVRVLTTCHTQYT